MCESSSRCIYPSISPYSLPSCVRVVSPTCARSSLSCYLDMFLPFQVLTVYLSLVQFSVCQYVHSASRLPPRWTAQRFFSSTTPSRAPHHTNSRVPAPPYGSQNPTVNLAPTQSEEQRSSRPISLKSSAGQGRKHPPLASKPDWAKCVGALRSCRPWRPSVDLFRKGKASACCIARVAWSSRTRGRGCLDLALVTGLVFVTTKADCKVGDANARRSNLLW